MSGQLRARTAPDPGVPPARVRGHRAGEPGAVHRRRQRRRHGQREVLRGRPAARRARRRGTSTASQTNFTPPNRDDYMFGNWRAVVGLSRLTTRTRATARCAAGAVSWSLAGKTDATGAARAAPGLPVASTRRCRCRSRRTRRVTDVNRQPWSASAALIVHPSTLYVGVKAKQPFVEKGTPFDARRDRRRPRRQGRARREDRGQERCALDWEYKHGQHRGASRSIRRPATVTAGADAAACTFATPKGGTYQVTATIVDEQGRPNQTKLEYWVTGGDVAPARDVAQEVRAAHPRQEGVRRRATPPRSSCRRRSIRPRRS